MCKKFLLKNLDCANCAAKMEDKISKIDGVKSVNINFMSTKMHIDFDENKEYEILKQCQQIITKLEPNTIMETL